MIRRIPTIGVLAFAAAAVAVGGAGAQDPAPQPGCTGIQFEDPAGDAVASPQGLGIPGAKAPDSYDVTGGFFRVDDGKTTANLRIANLDATNAPGADGARYYVFFTMGDVDNWVRATRTGDEVVYEFGRSDGTSLVTDGNTTGKMFNGKDGIVQIVVPAALKATGKTLTNTGGESRAISAEAGTLYWTDIAPDDANTGKPFTVAPCADAGGGTPPAPTDPGQTTPPPSSPPPPSKQPESNQPGTPPPTTAGPAALDVRVSAGKQSARKIGKRKRMTLKVSSSKGVTGLVATLKRGAKTAGSGKLAKVGGSAKLTIKVKRKLKPGSYTLSLSGTNADGQRAAGVVNLRIRKYFQRPAGAPRRAGRPAVMGADPDVGCPPLAPPVSSAACAGSGSRSSPSSCSPSRRRARRATAQSSRGPTWPPCRGSRWSSDPSAGAASGARPSMAAACRTDPCTGWDAPRAAWDPTGRNPRPPSSACSRRRPRDCSSSRPWVGGAGSTWWRRAAACGRRSRAPAYRARPRRSWC